MKPRKREANNPGYKINKLEIKNNKKDGNKIKFDIELLSTRFKWFKPTFVGRQFFRIKPLRHKEVRQRKNQKGEPEAK